jgi:DNA-binding NarL/FixJ family response regulator
MARQLLVSEATVKSHLAHVYDKLGVDTRTAAVAVAIERRIIRT